MLFCGKMEPKCIISLQKAVLWNKKISSFGVKTWLKPGLSEMMGKSKVRPSQTAMLSDLEKGERKVSTLHGLRQGHWWLEERGERKEMCHLGCQFAYRDLQPNRLNLVQ